MQSFRRFDRATYLLIGLLFVSLSLTTLDVRADQGGVGEVLRDGAQTLFSPLQKVAAAVVRPVFGLVDAISDLAGLREENERLRRQLADLEADVRETQSLRDRVESLERALDLEVPGELTAITARIFADGSSDFDRIRVIDKGSDEGIVTGQAVIDTNTGGLVGIIDLVTRDSARVRLITDPRSGVGVRNQRTSETGWVEGRGTAPLDLEMYSTTEAVHEGDLLVTDGSRFPPGFVVGTVLESAEEEAGFGTFSTVEPLMDLGRLDYVQVIVGWSPLDAGTGGDEDTSPSNRSVGTE